MQDLVRISKVLANEPRIRMLKLLLEKDICVFEMKEIMSLSHSQVSRDLRALMEAGFLRRWNEGKYVVYKAERNSSNECCRKMLDIMVECFDDDETVLRDRKKLQHVIEMQVREMKK